MKIRALLASALLLASVPAVADQTGQIRLSAAIGNDIVQIIEDGPQAIRIAVNDKTILDERKSQAITLVDVFNLKERWLVLFQQTSGGDDCPASYRILDLSEGKASISFPFGTCSAEPKTSAADGMLTVSMPGKAGQGEAAWTYGGGSLFRSK
jgi:hypothetical protein